MLAELRQGRRAARRKLGPRGDLDHDNDDNGPSRQCRFERSGSARLNTIRG